MADKRQRPWQDEYDRQRKTLVNENMINATDSNYMKQVYDKTNSLLFEGAKKIYKGDNAESPNKLASSTDQHSDYEMEEGAYNSDASSSIPLVSNRASKATQCGMDNEYEVVDSSSSIPLVSNRASKATQCGMEYEYEVVDKEKGTVINKTYFVRRAPSPNAKIKGFSFFKHNEQMAKECSIIHDDYVRQRLQKSDNGSENRNYVDPSPPNTFKPISPLIPKDDDDVDME